MSKKEYRDGGRTCVKCATWKPSEAFYEFRRVCKPCLVEHQRKKARDEPNTTNNMLLKQWRLPTCN